MNVRLRRTVCAFCLAALSGCAAAPVHDPPDAYLIRHRRARLYFDRGQYEQCVSALRGWLGRYEARHPDLAPSARFYIALSYKMMRRPEEARAAFRDVCRRYSGVPGDDPAAAWRRWAQEELGGSGE